MNNLDWIARRVAARFRALDVPPNVIPDSDLLDALRALVIAVDVDAGDEAGVFVPPVKMGAGAPNANGDPRDLPTVPVPDDVFRQVVMDLHDALGVPFGGNVYARIAQLKQAEAQLSVEMGPASPPPAPNGDPPDLAAAIIREQLGGPSIREQLKKEGFVEMPGWGPVEVQPPPALKELARTTGGTITECMRLPDGSGAAIMSYPLPKDHWSCVPATEYEAPPMRLRMAAEARMVIAIDEGPATLPWWRGLYEPFGKFSRRLTFDREEFRALVHEAGKYAYRSATMGGQEPDLDPDALLQNLVVAFIGYFSVDGRTGDEWANPPHERGKREGLRSSGDVDGPVPDDPAAQHHDGAGPGADHGGS